MDSNGISIIIPCYNDGKYIKEAISSVKSQTYTNWEIIVIDDGSTDRQTIEVLKEIRGEGIPVLNGGHHGPAAARNLGIDAAKGKYILPLDADDKIAPTYLEKAISVMESNPEIGVVYCYANLFGKASGRWELPDYSFSKMLFDNVVFVTSLFYREDWQRVGGFSVSMEHGLEDYDFWLSILELGRQIYQIPEVLFFYRIKTVSRTTKLKDRTEHMKKMYDVLFEKHKQLYAQYYDIVIPQLRNALLEQMAIKSKLEKLVLGLGMAKRVPWLRKLGREAFKR